MKAIGLFPTFAMAGALAFAPFAQGAENGNDSSPSPVLNAPQAEKLAEEAYIFGYPLVLMGVTRDVSTAVSRPTELKAPLNQFVHVRRFPDASFQDVVRPNADTLYSSAWLDLDKEPLVLSLPDLGDHYGMFPIMDAWTNVVASPGTRTTGNKANRFLLAGPGWKGEAPADMATIEIPTSNAWILGRIRVSADPADLQTVHSLQNQVKLVPLSAWEGDHAPPAHVDIVAGVDTATAPNAQVDRMDTASFFNRLNQLMESNPPFGRDTPLLRQLSGLGIAPSAEFSARAFDADVSAAIERGVANAKKKLATLAFPDMRENNGWTYNLNLGSYGRNYLGRATTAYAGLGANLAADSLYMFKQADDQGLVFDGSKKYVVRFAKDQMPPVKGFWSVTLYNERMLFAANPLNRYALGDRSGLQPNEDGSVDILIQHESPGADRESNWLPAPQGKFDLVLRLYWPGPAIFDATWMPPTVMEVK
ncbi:MAG: DUF1254 domain-containing protein [Bdellovibrionaceae bacterium]|nr:DUF1254 domain-containing protein [Pseudobdellovibrionaceae bacterium]MBX3032357.1 DUF1254 domain-containing protein [Pseudobdellovibrionaceae bacterium]